MPELAGHDDDVAVAHGGGDGGDAEPVDEQCALAAEELAGVGRERLELGGHPAAGLVEQVGDGVAVLGEAPEHLALAHVHRAVVEPDGGAVGEVGEHARTAVVDEHDAGLDEDLRAEVRVAPGDRRGRVDDPDDAGVEQRRGRRAVEVHLVDDGDVAGAEPAQVPGAGPAPAGRAGATQPGRAAHARRRLRRPRPSTRPSHGPMVSAERADATPPRRPDPHASPGSGTSSVTRTPRVARRRRQTCPRRLSPRRLSRRGAGAHRARRPW